MKRSNWLSNSAGHAGGGSASAGNSLLPTHSSSQAQGHHINSHHVQLAFLQPRGQLIKLVNSRRRLVTVLFLLLIGLLYWKHRDDAVSVHFRDLGYITRPLWEKPPERFKNVIRLSDDDALWRELDTSGSTTSSATHAEVCKAHGLQPLLVDSTPPRVYDVIIFSVELDLLEIRLRELYNIVDYFVIVESNVTFSGDSKPLVFKENQDQFAFAKDKIIHGTIGDLKPASSSMNGDKKEDPFNNEVKMRVGVSHFIESLQPPIGSIIVQSDVDEIPSSHAISLLKYCTGYPDIIHLGMPSYLYSFEFPMERQTSDAMEVNNGEGSGPRQWRASAKKYRSKAYNGYTHSRQSDTILEKAGWHLTFAFKYIDDFIFKMKSYSHNDRVTSPDLLLPDVIQDKICNGEDIYDMLPEAYDFKSLFNQWGPIPSSSDTNNIPKSVLEHKDRFDYLLPGGCRRELKRPN